MIKQYEKYKDSKIKWIGAVPDSWWVSNIRYNAKVVGRIGYRGYTVEDIVDKGEGAISLSPSNIQNQAFDLAKRTYISWEKYEESPEIQVFEGDVILVKTASVGKVAYVDSLKGEKATINPQLVVFKNITMNSRFFYYYLISNDFQYQIDRDNYGGVVGTLTQASINSYKILVPSELEQSKIAQYLDNKIATIDQIIQQKEKLIELLKEKRQSVINEAVTKGLNPNAKMKYSEIDWMGDIPFDWKVVSLKRLIDPERPITYGIVQPGEGDPKGRFMIRGQDYSRGWAEPESLFKVSDEIEIPYARARVKKGDILITIVGAGVGNLAVVPEWLEGANLTQTTARIAIQSDIADAEYMMHLLGSEVGKTNINLWVKGAAQPGLNLSHIKNYKFPLPVLSEQIRIREWIDKKVSQILPICDLLEKAINKLKEYRQSIISEAVTGKIDVRD